MKPITWYLESSPRDSAEIRRIALRPLPFVIGRRNDCDLLLDSQHGSQRHAEFFKRDGALWLRDLGSTNGTSVNGSRLTADYRVSSGDAILFADREYRLVAEVPVLASATSELQKTQALSRSQVVRLEQLVRQPQAFLEMLSQNKLLAHFQPLVRLRDRRVLGYEVLGRGELDGRLTSPNDLFFLAEKHQRQVELSAAFRAKGLEQAQSLPDDPLLFVNTHPDELSDCEVLLRSLELLRKRYPAVQLVLEIHEAAVTDISSLEELKSGLDDLMIGLAFDDFGVGQARLLELSEIGPNYLKFDAVLIQQLHLAARKRRELIKSLLRMVADMGIAAIAECIETAEEAQACIDIGFGIGQGYFFGRPAPAESFG